jgi:hypothetical protein
LPGRPQFLKKVGATPGDMCRHDVSRLKNRRRIDNRAGRVLANYSAASGNTASILVFSVAALNGLTM